MPLICSESDPSIESPCRACESDVRGVYSLPVLPGHADVLPAEGDPRDAVRPLLDGVDVRGYVRVMLEGRIPYPYSPDTPTPFPPRVIPGMPYDPFLAGLLGRKGLSPFSAASLARFARSELRTVRDPRQRSGISGR
eukprot:880742-Pyramimonas_sp.AAC.1